MENKWIIEDIDEAHCSACGYATTEISFSNKEKVMKDLFPDKYNDDAEYVIKFPGTCPKCGAKMTSIRIIGDGTKAALDEAIENNNGFYKF